MRTRRWRPLRWLLGLPFLAVLGAIALFGELPSIQDDLVKRSSDALQAAGLTWAKVDFTGRDGRVMGEASSAPDQKAAVETTLGNWGVRVVEDGTSLIDAVRPYTWSLTRDGGTARIRGYADNDADRAAVHDASANQLHGLTLNETLKSARGMPPLARWLGAIGFASAQMAGLSKGQASLEDLNLTISGTAATPKDYAEIIKALAGPLPAGVKLVKAEITPLTVNPYTWQADWKRGQLALDGYVSDDQVRSKILQTANSVFPGASLSDHLLLAAGAPDHFADAAIVALAQLARLESGSAKITGTAAELIGVAVEQDDAEAASAAFKKGLPAGYTSVQSVSYHKARVPLASPFVWMGLLAGDTIELSGVVPDQRTKDDIAAYVARHFPSLRTYDHSTLARGAPFGFEQAATAGLDQLARLDRGTLKLTDSAMDVSGHARDADTANGLQAPLTAALPHGFASTVSVLADPPKPPAPVVVLPYVWDAALDHGVLTVTGATPGLQARDTLLDHLRSRLPGISVVNKLSQINGVPSSQDDWLQTVDATLKAIGGLGGGHVHIEDRDVTVTGVTSDKAAPDAIERTLRDAVPSPYQVSTHIAFVAAPAALAVPPKPARQVVVVPYVWDAALDHGALTLTGATPGLDARDMLLERVRSRLPGAKVANNLSQINGVPSSQDDWLQTVDAGLKAIAGLGGGSVHIEDRSVTVTGVTNDKTVPESVMQALRKAVPSPYQVTAHIDYVPPPVPSAYLTTLKYDGQKVVLEGSVPDQAVKSKLVDRLKHLFPDRQFDDQTSVQEGAPQGWYDALVQGVGSLASLTSGQLTLRDRSLTLSGKAEDQKVVEAAREKISAGLPAGYSGLDLLTYVPAPTPDPALLAKKKDETKYDVGKLMKQSSNLNAGECQAVLNEAFKGKIFFAFARADLEPRSTEALLGIVSIARRCPNTRVEISGYTDSDGAPGLNQRLSELRAQAVVDFLTGKGISAARLKAVGYGETHPVVPNDTVANKALNRRIEFVVTPG